jgi:KDO2-lipid IV(A) lauroyltransferase
LDSFSTFLLRLLAYLPLPVTHMLGIVTGWLLWLLPTKKRRFTRINLALCFPRQSGKERSTLSRSSLMETSKTIFELPLLLTTKNPLRLIKKVSGEEFIQQPISAGRGVIISAPHLGAWELVGLYCSQHYPMTNLYRPKSRADNLNNFIRTGRQRLGAKLVPTDATGIRSLYTALKKGEMIGILPDQNPGAGAGRFAPFFGVQANTMVLLSRLTRKTNARVIYAYAERLPWSRGFHLHFLPAPEAIYSEDIDESLTALNLGVEQCVLLKPEQYWWSYNRFRVRPPGEPPVY